MTSAHTVYNPSAVISWMNCVSHRGPMVWWFFTAVISVGIQAGAVKFHIANLYIKSALWQ